MSKGQSDGDIILIKVLSSKMTLVSVKLTKQLNRTGVLE